MPVVYREGSLFWMMEKVDARVDELIDKFLSRFGDNIRYMEVIRPDVMFGKRGLSAGTCSFNYTTGAGMLNFNRIIMMDNWDAYDETVIHEVAHWCCSFLYGYQVGHGKEWKRMMHFFGAEGERCHSYDVSRVRKARKTFTYACVCGKHDISSIRHKRIVESGTKYFCKKCKQDIKYVDNA